MAGLFQWAVASEVEAPEWSEEGGEVGAAVELGGVAGYGLGPVGHEFPVRPKVGGPPYETVSPPARPGYRLRARRESMASAALYPVSH